MAIRNSIPIQRIKIQIQSFHRFEILETEHCPTNMRLDFGGIPFRIQNFSKGFFYYSDLALSRHTIPRDVSRKRGKCCRYFCVLGYIVLPHRAVVAVYACPLFALQGDFSILRGTSIIGHRQTKGVYKATEMI